MIGGGRVAGGASVSGADVGGASLAGADVALPGVSQVTKEEKRGIVRGALKRLRMYAEILRQLVLPQRNTPDP